ncbi:MAG: hypothetical protein K1X72_19625 [Pyrinomonadaceae bacterium]|nr:hypothetical protein [Pyrinomonadaceae bacterium]
MFNNNHQNLPCNFAEEIISYLYNEMNHSEKINFETHLPDCAFCAREIADFTSVRSEIINWKSNEFDLVPTPVIEIPYENSVQVVRANPISRPWYAGIREYFSLSPIWLTASTAMALLAICIGLVLVTINSLKNPNDKIAQKNPPVSTPTIEVKNVNSAISNVEPTKPRTSNSTVPPKENPTENPNTTNVGEKQNKKPQNTTPKRNLPLNSDKNGNSPTPKFNKKSNSKSLTGDDEEDNSLRLSDLFDEIGDELKK